MEIESLRLDFHLKRKQKKSQGQQENHSNAFVREERKKKKKTRRMCSSEKKEKKKKKKNPDRSATWVARRPGSRGDLGPTATWVAVRPGSHGDLVAHGLGRRPGSVCVAIPSSSSSSLSFFFLSFCLFFRCFCILGWGH